MRKAVCIWAPKYSTKEVLIAKTEVHDGDNFVYFCADRNHTDLYKYNGEEAKKCKIISNGKIQCYAIPLSNIQSVGELPQEYVATRDKEYAKYKAFIEKLKKK